MHLGPKKSTVEYDRELAVLVEDGLTIREISEALNVSYDSARNAIRRRGLKAAPETQNNYRTAIQDMKALDAVEYLLDCIEVLQGTREQETPTDRWGFHVTEKQSRILALLEDRAPNVVSKAALYDAMYFDLINYGDRDPKMVDVQICKMRKIIPPEYGEIKTVWGKGFWLEKS